MTETEKRQICEWMEKEEKYHNGFIMKPGAHVTMLAAYNPDTNPEQFLEVLGHMSEDERIAVEIWMLNNTSYADIKVAKISMVTFTLYCFKNKSEVIKAHLQTINQ